MCRGSVLVFVKFNFLLKDILVRHSTTRAKEDS